MQEILQGQAYGTSFETLSKAMGATLQSIAALIRRGEISPWHKLRLGPEEPEYPAVEHQARLGVFPVAANPFHWMHFIAGLVAISRFKLDKVVYILAGNDPRKPYLLPTPIRHQIGEEVLRGFAPFFEYSPITLGNDFPGEENVFRLLQLNAGQRIHAFYLVGSDHYQRFHPQTGSPDTIQRLEEGIRNRIHGFSKRLHRISVLFLDRGLPKLHVETFLNIEWIRDLPLQCSSTGIREALDGCRALNELSALPYTVFHQILLRKLYGTNAAAGAGNHPKEMGKTPVEDIPAAHQKRRDFLGSLARRVGVPASL